MAANIKPIDGKSIHQIQSGQVIVDLCSVVKELLENSIDAGATNIDVRFKNQGLDLIEIQDNGSGISLANYPFVALKHHTSKLSSFSDIASLQTFGFRGEALASLCALSTLTVTTCVQGDVPKGSRLSFEHSGRLGGVVVVAAQRGTIVSVEDLFHNLPVRRRELERNIKREWQKVVALLSQYACVQTGVKLSVSQQPTKGKRAILFSTRGNSSTRENIINIFGAKAILALVSMDLEFEIQPTATGVNTDKASRRGNDANRVRVVGHISRPSPGDGRQTPDRQMFFVNGRPCGLPQFAKTFNEVYRSFNYSQAPFIFADVRLDTQMYDVNVSPDKRSILLHDQGRLLDTLRTSLATLFESHDCMVPVSRPGLGSPINSRALPRTTSAGEAQQNDDGDSEDSASHLEAESSRQDPMAGKTRLQSRSTTKDENLMSQWLKGVPRAAPASTPSIPGKCDSWPTSRHGSDASATTSSASDTPRDSPSAFATTQGHPRHPSGAVRDLDARLARGNGAVEEVVEDTEDDTAVSVSSLTDGYGGRHGEPRVHAVKPLRLRTSGSTQPLPLKNSTSRPPSEDAGNASQRGERGSFLGAGCAPDDDEEPGSEDSFPQNNGSDLARDLEEGDRQLGDARGAKPSLEQMPERASQDFSSSDDNLHDMLSKRSDGGAASKSCSGINANADRLTWPDPREDTLLGGGSNSCVAAPKAPPAETSSKRSNALWQANQRLQVDEEDIRSRAAHLKAHRWTKDSATPTVQQVEDISASDAESKLSLTVSRSDFSTMQVVGQFNMGFIIAVQPAAPGTGQSRGDRHDEVFIIDQHASDEKFNFERLQSTTTVQSQGLVHPRKLELTALEEEIVMGNLAALEANGFKVAVDTSGSLPVGSRCEVLALPLSRETTFGLDDLEELIALLGDEPGESDHVPRPSKVRRMFAMRACRSSVMIGKALTRSQMYVLVRQMGELDKPWNCPHGRPTMRHLCRLQAWDQLRWDGDTATGSAAAWRLYAGGD